MIELRDLSRRFGTTTVLEGIALTLPEGSFVALLGPSGCGKSTLLRLIAGLDRPSAGQVLIAGRDVADLGPAERNIAMVFQSHALYPHLTVAENIALPLAMRRLGRLGRSPLGALIPAARATRRAIAREAARVAEALEIGALLARRPAELSGGQKQRVALARALVRDPVAFLLDEPLSNLDARLRMQMRAELVALHRRTGRTFVHVTHDQAEAMGMADRVAVMLSGRIAQVGSPRDLYGRPASAAVAAFVGHHPINLIDGALAERLVGRPGTLAGIRPEHLAPDPGGALSARLERVEFLGEAVLIEARQDGGLILRALAGAGWAPPAPGTALRLGFAPQALHVFGCNMVLFLAGLAAIPQQLCDAAEVDGAGRPWERFWTVTWPMLGPTTLFVAVITATGAFRVFETVATLTQGGPAFASDVLVYAMYREGFVYFKAGHSSALTMIFFALVLAVTVLKFRVLEARVHYR